MNQLTEGNVVILTPLALHFEIYIYTEFNDEVCAGDYSVSIRDIINL